MHGGDTHMLREIREAPEAVGRQADALRAPLAELVGRLRRQPPQVAVTCARGSSAHAATFGKHLIERYLGIPVAAAAPSVATVYRQRLRLRDQLFLAISQSGRSDDLIEQTAAARAAGAVTVALVNATDSPLAEASDIVLPMEAGPELSVAATKTFIASASALLRLLALWSEDRTMAAALGRLPDRLGTAADLDWSEALTAFEAATSLVTIGRGPTLAVAREASLKLKETCNLHAEAFSGAEFLHGPVALVDDDYPILMFVPTDAAQAGLLGLSSSLRKKGALLYAAEPGEPAAGRLPALAADHPEADAICLIQSFYGLAVRLAERRGIDVDRPRHLQKVTRTR
ncbi:MAG TPA: SIS domain-containing protein [Beijerinckiaceae bacterium]|nr:SIS domain-containing protein [Beijerinckiaceae bacterium]